MPVIAPIIAVAASGWAVSAAAAAAWTFFPTLIAVSSVVGAVGVITKNKTLMTIGAVGAAIGGIGQWAQQVGAFGFTATAKGAPVAAASGSAMPVAPPPPPVAGAAAGAGVPIAPVAAGGIETITVSASGAPFANATAGQNAAIAANAAAAAKAQSGEALSKQQSETLTAKKVDVPEDNGFLKGFATFAKDNGALLILGGSTLTGLFEQPAEGSAEKTRAETAALEQQTAEKNIQLANMQAPLARFAPAAVPGYRGVDPNTGRPVQYATRTAADPGLINTITGAPV